MIICVRLRLRYEGFTCIFICECLSLSESKLIVCVCCLCGEGFICICECLSLSESKLIVWVCVCHCNEGFICICQRLSLCESKLMVRMCVCLHDEGFICICEYLSLCESKLIRGGGGVPTWWRFYLYLWMPELVWVQADCRGVFVRLEVQQRLHQRWDDQGPPSSPWRWHPHPDVRPPTHDQLCLSPQPGQAELLPCSAICILRPIPRVIESCAYWDPCPQWFAYLTHTL